MFAKGRFRTAYCLFAASFILSGCASRAMLPESAATAAFGGAEGKTGWSAYQESALFKDKTIQQVHDAAKAGLAKAGFTLREANIEQGMAIGEHGITLHDWNILAGVYYRTTGQGVEVTVVVEGSKDIGFSGDVTSGAWTGNIIAGMREYINENS